MGFFKRLYEGGKKVLGKVVEGAKTVRTLKDKGLALLDKAKNIPVLGTALDAGIEAVMATPVGKALRFGNKALDVGIGAGEKALQMLRDREARTGTPTVEQLKDIGSATLRDAKRNLFPPAEEEESNMRLEALKSE